MSRLPIEGESFGRYRLLRKLGQGGMGVVYAAHDTSLDREVAVKLVVPHLAGDEEFRARFQQEAAVLAKLESPRIVRIYDHGEHDRTLFLVTQLVAGGDLHKLINREGPLPPALAAGVLAQVVEGLCDAHAVGVTHRDIKPGNVLLRERGRELEAFLCDFGIATTPGAELSRTGTIAGSLPYMAPERHQGEDAGAQGDVYAAGCLLWHALTGSAPYAGTDVEVAVAHMQAPIPRLPGKDEFSGAANAIITRSMAKDRRKRYSTARAMLTDLRALSELAPDVISLPGSTAIRQQVTIGTRPRRWMPAVAAVAAVLAFLATAVVAAGAMRGGAEPTSGQSDVPATSEAGTPVIVPPSSRRAGSGAGSGAGSAPRTAAGKQRTAAGPGAFFTEAGDIVRPSSKPTRPPATQQPPAPVYRFQCWSGTRVETEAECSTYPTGDAAFPWIYANFPNYPGCRRYDNPDTANDVEGRICEFTYPDGVSTWVSFLRWRSVADARAHYRAWFNHDFHFVQEPWVRGGTTYGTDMYGRWGKEGGRYRTVRFYTVNGTQPWSISVSASTAERREYAAEYVQGYRSPYEFRAKPL